MRARGQSSSGVRFCNVAYFYTSGAFGNTGRAVCSQHPISSVRALVKGLREYASLSGQAGTRLSLRL